METTLIQPDRIIIYDDSSLGAGRAREYVDEEMQNGDVLQHASDVLARNLRERRFVGMVPNPSMPPRVHFNQPLPVMDSEPLEPSVTNEEQAIPASPSAASQVAAGTPIDTSSLPVAEDIPAVVLCLCANSKMNDADSAEQQNLTPNEVQDAEPEPRPINNPAYVSESVARKKKRVTDATCLREMVTIQEQYLQRDLRMEREVSGTLSTVSSILQEISSLVQEERKYLEKKEKREEEKLELKRREVEIKEKGLKLRKKELGVPIDDSNTQTGDGTSPLTPQPPDSGGNVASV